MLSTYSNRRMSWNHREMFQDLIDEIWLAQGEGIFKSEAAEKLVTMINN